ncbi:MAG: hypothetical protein DWQ53_09865 [Microcystis flos-aquae DF17]|nr:MAG: hypothetical protein DWQ53_09865 [Microcystis flos-aquae DF17]
MTEIIKLATGRRARVKKAKPTTATDKALTASKGKLTSALILGWTADGHMYFDASTVTAEAAIFLTEAFKSGVFADIAIGGDDEDG